VSDEVREYLAQAQEEIKNLKVQLAEVKRLSPGAICQRFRIQGCSWCECIECNDNTSPAKTKLAEAEATLRRYGWRPNQLDCLGRETHGECPRCTGALICVEACDLGDPKVCPRCGHEDHLSSHPDCPGVNRTVASGDLVPRGETEARLNEETNHHATLLDEFSKFTAEVEALREIHRLANTCVTCGADLRPNDEPPHCPDCVIDEDEEEDWTEDYHAALMALDVAWGGGQPLSAGAQAKLTAGIADAKAGRIAPLDAARKVKP
jgi:hypothetical protein